MVPSTPRPSRRRRALRRARRSRSGAGSTGGRLPAAISVMKAATILTRAGGDAAGAHVDISACSLLAPMAQVDVGLGLRGERLEFVAAGDLVGHGSRAPFGHERLLGVLGEDLADALGLHAVMDVIGAW